MPCLPPAGIGSQDTCEGFDPGGVQRCAILSIASFAARLFSGEGSHALDLIGVPLSGDGSQFICEGCGPRRVKHDLSF